MGSHVSGFAKLFSLKGELLIVPLLLGALQLAYEGLQVNETCIIRKVNDTLPTVNDASPVR